MASHTDASFSDAASLVATVDIPKPKGKAKKKSTKAMRKLTKANNAIVPEPSVPTASDDLADSYTSLIRESIYGKAVNMHQGFPLHLDANTVPPINSDDIAEVLDCRIAEKIKSELENKMSCEELQRPHTSTSTAEMEPTASGSDLQQDALPSVPTKAKRKVIFKEKRRNKMKKYDATDEPPPLDGLLSIENLSQCIIKNELRRLKRMKKSCTNTDMNNVDAEQDDPGADASTGSTESDASGNVDEVDPEEIATAVTGSSSNQAPSDKCSYCKVRHNDDNCPIASTTIQILDALNYQKWFFDACHNRAESSSFEANGGDEQASLPEPDDDVVPYAEASLPSEFEIVAKNTKCLGVFAKQPIGKYARLGPLQGPFVDEVDISDDNAMEHVIEMNNGYKSTFINVDDDMKSNWLKYVRPAPSINDRNTVLVREDNEIFFVTSKEVAVGDELLYWSDKCNTRWKKNVGSKTSAYSSLTPIKSYKMFSILFFFLFLIHCRLRRLQHQIRPSAALSDALFRVPRSKCQFDHSEILLQGAYNILVYIHKARFCSVVLFTNLFCSLSHTRTHTRAYHRFAAAFSWAKRTSQSMRPKCTRARAPTNVSTVRNSFYA